MWGPLKDTILQFMKLFICYIRHEGLDEFMKATNGPMEFLPLMKKAKAGFEKTSDGWVFHENFDGYRSRNEFKLDEEFDYSFPGKKVRELALKKFASFWN